MEKVKHHARSFPWVPALLVTGAALRLSGLTVSALWYDEAFSVVMARLGLFEMVRALQGNISPPGWEIVVWFSTRLLGWNELGARIVPFLASLIGMWAAYRLAQAFHLDPLQQVGAMALIALLPYQLWMSQDGRMYAIYSLLYAVAILWALEGRWLGLGAVLGLMLWFHNTALFYIPAIGVLALVAHRRERSQIAVVFAFVWAMWLPWITVVFRQTRLSLPWFMPLTGSLLLGSLMTALFVRTLSMAWAPFAVVVLTITVVLLIFDPLLNWIAFQMRFELASGPAFLASLWRRLMAQFTVDKDHLTPADSQRLLFWLVIVPLALFIVASWLGQNAILYRTLSPLVIPLALWFAFALNPRWLKTPNWLLAAAWACLLVVALAGWSPASRGSNLFQVRDMIRARWQPGDVIYHASGTTAVVFWHYLPDKEQYLLDAENGLGQGIARMAQMNVPLAPLDKIPHRRAWVVWSREEILQLIDKRIDERMAEYVKGCPLVGTLPYWQVGVTEIYLCGE
jgi:hypothetical protein